MVFQNPLVNHMFIMLNVIFLKIFKDYNKNLLDILHEYYVNFPLYPLLIFPNYMQSLIHCLNFNNLKQINIYMPYFIKIFN